MADHYPGVFVVAGKKERKFQRNDPEQYKRTVEAVVEEMEEMEGMEEMERGMERGMIAEEEVKIVVACASLCLLALRSDPMVCFHPRPPHHPLAAASEQEVVKLHFAFQVPVQEEVVYVQVRHSRSRRTKVRSTCHAQRAIANAASLVTFAMFA